MAIGADYPSPVTVNGFSCKNCTEVDEAKKFIDPAHPKDGPFGIDAKDHKAGDRNAGAAKDPSHSDRSPSVVFGGQLAARLANGQGPTGSGRAAPIAAVTQNSSATTGTRLDIFA